MAPVQSGPGQWLWLRRGCRPALRRSAVIFVQNLLAHRNTSRGLLASEPPVIRRVVVSNAAGNWLRLCDCQNKPAMRKPTFGSGDRRVVNQVKQADRHTL